MNKTLIFPLFAVFIAFNVFFISSLEKLEYQIPIVYFVCSVLVFCVYCLHTENKVKPKSSKGKSLLSQALLSGVLPSLYYADLERYTHYYYAFISFLCFLCVFVVCIGILVWLSCRK